MRLIGGSFLIFGVSCNSEKAVTIYNNEPSVAIVSHSNGSEILEGTEIVLIGQVSDGNHSGSELAVTWSSNIRELCSDVPSVDGATSCTVALSAEETEVLLQAVDPEGASGLASVDLTILPSQAPTAQILSPSIDGDYYSDQLILFSALIGDAEDEPADLTYSWTSNLDGELPITAQVESSGEVEQYLYLTEGQHAISLTVEDNSGKTTTETVAITVGGVNTEPTCEILLPESGLAYTQGENIYFSGIVDDPDINNNQLVVSWSSDIDGVFNTVPANTNGDLALVYNTLSVGNHIVTLTVEDEVGGNCSDTTLVSIGTPPVITLSSPLDGDMYSLGGTVSFIGTVTDLEDISSDIQMSWVSDIDGEFSVLGPNSNGEFVNTVSDLSAGQHSITITATDSSGLTDSFFVTIDINTPPEPPNLTLSPLPAYTNDGISVTLSGGGDADGDLVSYAYLWLKNGIATSNTTSSVPASDVFFGDTWTVQVTPNDGYTDGDVSEASVVISNTSPTLDSLSLSPLVAYSDTVMTCSATASDIDPGTLSYLFEWTNLTTGTTYNTVTSTTPSDAFDLSTVSPMAGDVIECSVTVSDSGGGTAQGSTSVEIDISNLPPSVDSVVLEPNPLYTTDTLVAITTASDPEGDPLTYTYSWKVDGVLVQSGADDQLDASFFSKDESIEVLVSVNDGFSTSPTSSQTILCSNSLPSAPGISLSPSAPIEQIDDLICSVDTLSSDLDGDSISYTFAWTVNGAAYSGASSTAFVSTVPASVTTSGELWECSVTPNDGDGDGMVATTSVNISSDVGEEVFSYTGSVQTFVVPQGVFQISATLEGAQGGQGTKGGSGLGGEVTGVLSVQPGDVLYVYVGGQGSNGNGATGGFNGGADGGGGNDCGNYGGGGGGGASDLRTTQGDLNSRVIVAGGGGGGGANGNNGQGLTGGYGGDEIGGAGSPSGSGCNGSGQGGTQTAGGARGQWGCATCDSTDGSFGSGGNGNNNSGCGGCQGGGGGGGGWYGGGGGGLGAGGGGSSYIDPTVVISGVSHTQGATSGDGFVTISW